MKTKIIFKSVVYLEFFKYCHLEGTLYRSCF